MTLSENLAAFVASIRAEELPAAVREAARLHLLDMLGLMVLGGAEPEAQAMAAYARSQAVGGALSAPLAAFTAAGAIHSTHLDCFHEHSRIHPGAPVLPALLAAATAPGVTGADLLAALVAGFEVVCRLSLGAPDRILHRRGFHPTATCGVFAAAAAVGRLLRLSPAQIADAMGIAGTQVPGSFEFDERGWTKPLQVGWSAQGGVTSAQLAGRGYPGPLAILDSPIGFFASHCGEGNYYLERVTEDLGQRWMVAETSYLSAAHFSDNLTAAAAAVQALRQLGASPADVTRIDVAVPAKVYDRTAVPEAEHRRPVGGRTARVSLYWSVAIAVARQRDHGPADSCHDAYTDVALADPLLRVLADRVHAVAAADLGPGPNPARVSLAAGGREATVSLTTAPGDARWPASMLGPEAVTERFRQHAAASGPEAVEGLLRAVAQLESLPSVAALSALRPKEAQG